jgi:hypothetical protein
MVVFASGKDRRVAGAPLHANFKLDSGGEYLALSRPDGSPASALSYPPQFPDISFGLAMQVSTATLIASNANAFYRIPTDAADDATWTQPGFAQGQWSLGTNGLGYETGLSDTNADSFYQKVLDTQPIAYWRLNETNGPAAVNIGTEGIADEAGYRGNVVPGDAGPRPPEFAFFETDNNAPSSMAPTPTWAGPIICSTTCRRLPSRAGLSPLRHKEIARACSARTIQSNSASSHPGTLQIWSFNGSVNYDYPYPPDEWHYLGAEGGEGQLALFIDGAIVASTTGNACHFRVVGLRF